MRNLIALNRGTIPLASQSAPDLPLAQSQFSPVDNSITTVLGPGEFGVYEIQQIARSGEVTMLSSFPHKSELVNFVHFVDQASVVMVFKNGDLVNVNYETGSIERVGQIYAGITAASFSQDEETLVLTTEANTVIFFSRDFQCLADVELKEEDSQLSNHVDVGWGSKETQFRGKGAKQIERDLIKHLDLERDHNKRDPTMPLDVDKGVLSLLDVGEAEIAWRKDCEFVAVSTITEVNSTLRRMIRVFKKDGELVNVSEPVDGQEWSLTWGYLITSIQRTQEEIRVAFFEKNGLRHGEFDTRLPLESKIDQMVWNSNNETLAILADNKVYIWTTKNYHWYLKQELTSLEQITLIQWHPEKPLTLMLGTQSVLEIVDFAHKTTTGPTVSPMDIGMNLVVDGCTVMITPLSIANVPPPMSFRELDVEGNVLDCCVSRSNEHYAVLTNDAVFIATRGLEDMRKGKHPEIVGTLNGLGGVMRQVVFINDDSVFVLMDDEGSSQIFVVDVTNMSEPEIKDIIPCETKVVLMKPSANWSKLTYECITGELYSLESSADGYNGVMVTTFPQLCYDYEFTSLETKEQEYEGYSEWREHMPDMLAFGLTSNGKLYMNETLLTSSATSLKMTDNHLIITTAQHTLRFIHLSSNIKPLVESTDLNDERIRTIERGSLLVNVIPSKSSVILQAPRGNLETVNPRMMILSGVRRDIKNKDYKPAFITCRTHRIDLDILYDYDPQLFNDNVELFVKQVSRVDYLDLFVSCLHEEDVTKTKYRETNGDDQATAQTVAEQKTKWIDPKDSKINKICESVLAVLLKPAYREQYLQTIITAYACERPANLESALQVIHSIDDVAQAEKCVIHLCFLQDVNLLYKVALGIYDIKLTLAIAQQSQMDPKEYLPFLQNLFEQEDLRRKFLIDTHLKKFEKAIGHLAQLQGAELTEEFKDFVVKHELYKTVLSLFRYEIEKQNIILGLYAKHLSSKQEYIEAGLTYELLGSFDSALESYINGQKWREALTIVELPEFRDQLEDVAGRLITALTENHKYCDAARVQLRLGNIEQTVSLYCKEYYYEDAILLATTESLSLIKNIVDPALDDGFGTIAELTADCKGQLESQLKRLRELREKKEQDPYAFFGQVEGSEVADNVSIAPSETSTKDSFFTRYTGKTSGTAKTGASRRTVKNKRREERKRARGKKGTIYEEEYLVKSVGRMLERLDQTKPEAVRLIEGLLRRSKREQAHQIQKNFVELLAKLKENVQEIYNISEKDRERIDENGEVYFVPEIPVPVVVDFPVKNILDY